ncbi:E3 ubiquitin-protein ligase TRIP12-like [Pollicipes pollicipes]|uniref:E3 ubiquitin-protein ligase TRIP12-like n=1 Tax=Pollicipes pollicipes TaxID=41117 RepID=UPI001884B140|nr:E3 ubiquitin-protein ligase TRIP12-like [Pollicipes pollicipes]
MLSNAPDGRGCKIQQLLQGLQASGDENQQLQAVIELGQLLVMGNEDTLATFPVSKVIPPLIRLIQMDHNFDVMNQACRTLTYLLETLPHSSATAVAALPALLRKLQRISCMDVAEQALVALDLISRRHSNGVLQAGGVASCLAFIDFFSVAAQRSALSVTANCCLSLTPAEFHRISDHLAPLARRLAHEDQKVAEAACLVFCRLAETFKTDPLKVQAIADSGALINVQQLLVASPAVIGSSTFCEVARMLRMLCSHCPDIAVRLLSENMAETLRTLLSGDTEQMAQQSRNSEEVYALVCLLAEMLPALPAAGLFDVDQWLSRVPPRPTSSHDRDSVVWQWQDDEGSWHNFSEADSAAIQAAARSDGSRDPSRPELANLPSRSRAEIIEMQEMSVHLAGLLSSTDVKMVVAGVQLSETLMQKLPDLCRVHYKREGVVHHMTCLAAGDDPLEGVGSRTARPAQVGETSTDM